MSVHLPTDYEAKQKSLGNVDSQGYEDFSYKPNYVQAPIKATYDEPYPTGVNQWDSKTSSEPPPPSSGTSPEASTSAPASSVGGKSTGAKSIPVMNKIPHAEQIKSLLTLRSMM